MRVGTLQQSEDFEPDVPAQGSLRASVEESVLTKGETVNVTAQTSAGVPTTFNFVSPTGDTTAETVESDGNGEAVAEKALNENGEWTIIIETPTLEQQQRVDFEPDVPTNLNLQQSEDFE